MDALAYLARSLKVNPTNAAALTRLMTLLSNRSLLLPATKAMKHSGRVVSARFSLDGKWVVTASEDNTARVWDAQTGQPMIEPAQTCSPSCFSRIQPGWRWVVTASFDNTARVWDAQTGQPMTEPLKHAGAVTSAQFSPDGKRVVTASADNTARVWDAQTGQPMTEPFKHAGGTSRHNSARMASGS